MAVELTNPQVTHAAPATGAIVKKAPAPIAMGDRGIRLTTLEDAFRFARVVVESGLAPKGIDTPERAMIAMQVGAELGFTPMRALSAVTVINGKPSIYGEAALALIHDRGICTIPPSIRHDGQGDERRAILKFQRKTQPEAIEVSFSVAEAKKAKLWGKAGPWTEYPDDMLAWRAISRACKRYFSDVTLGLTIAEELRDYPADTAKSAPPAEPDPLLAEAQVVEEAAPVTPDEAELTRAVEKLEGRIVTAESLADLSAAWSNASALLAQLGDAERSRLAKLYEQNASNFKD